MDLKLQKNYLIRGIIHCETGMHIGGVAESLKIGGTDSPVIMNRMTNRPYIPGSSIKRQNAVIARIEARG